jgi:hypothetical protein
MYIHKYFINDMTVYVVSDKSSKPSKNMTLTAQDWKGYSSGSNVGNAIRFLKGCEFSKEEEKIKKKKASIVIQKYAEMIRAGEAEKPHRIKFKNMDMDVVIIDSTHMKYKYADFENWAIPMHIAQLDHEMKSVFEREGLIKNNQFVTKEEKKSASLKLNFCLPNQRMSILR